MMIAKYLADKRGLALRPLTKFACWGSVISSVVFILGVLRHKYSQSGRPVGRPPFTRPLGAMGRYLCMAILIRECLQY